MIAIKKAMRTLKHEGARPVIVKKPLRYLHAAARRRALLRDAIKWQADHGNKEVPS